MKTVTLKVCALYFFVSLATNVRTDPIPDDEDDWATQQSIVEDVTPSITTTTPTPPREDYDEIKSTTETVHHAETFEMNSKEGYLNDGTLTTVTDYKAENYDFSSRENTSHTDEQINSSNSSTTTITPVTVSTAENYDISSREKISHADNINFTMIMSTTAMPMPIDNKTENINSLKNEKTSHVDYNTNFSMDNKSEGANSFNNFSTTRVSSDHNVLTLDSSNDGIISYMYTMYGRLKLYTISSWSSISDYMSDWVPLFNVMMEQAFKDVNDFQLNVSYTPTDF